ncbi:hypothetical protein pb186bvf_000444 [Paramecium bursaria]
MFDLYKAFILHKNNYLFLLDLKDQELYANVPQNFTSGTRVSFFAGATTGSFSQFALSDWRGLIKLDDDVTFEDAASAIVNPLTVVGMLHTTKEHGVQAVVHNAAASALGRQFSRYFKDHGVQVINIVRRQQQVDLLLSEGAEIVLNETSENFLQELKELSQKLNATFLFEPVAGETTGKLLEQLPNGSTAFVYGFLGGNYVNNISVELLAFQNKTITGWWLTPWLRKNQILQKEEFLSELNKLLKGSLKTTYAKQFGLAEINEAIQFYQNNQTQGKVLIRPFKQ